MLNEAFLERFPVTFEQDYPSPSIENKILKNVADSLKVKDVDFCKRLVDWVTLSVRHFMMVVSKRSSVLVDWFISYVHILSLRIRQKQFKFV